MSISILGHRGFMATNNTRLSQQTARFPENTLISFQKAIEIGCDGFELDVALTKDGEVVVIHDDELYKNVIEFYVDDRSRPQLVSDYSYHKLKTFNVGKGQGIPRLKDVLDLVSNKAKKNFIVNIEVKGESVSLATLDIINRHRGINLNNIFINSFNWDKLRRIRKNDPDINLVPNLKTVQLFGEDNVKIPGFIVNPAAVYKDSFKRDFIDINREIGCYAIDLTAYDYRDELLNLVSHENVGICLSETYSKNSGQSFKEELAFIHSIITRIKGLDDNINCFYKTNRPVFTLRDLKSKFDGQDAPSLI